MMYYELIYVEWYSKEKLRARYRTKFSLTNIQRNELKKMLVGGKVGKISKIEKPNG